MKRLVPLLLVVFTCCLLPTPAVAKMKPMAAGKVESAAEKRARVMKERQAARKKKEQEEQEARQKKAREEEEARWEKERAEAEARAEKDRAEYEARAEQERAEYEEARLQEERQRAEELERRQAELLHEQKQLEDTIARAALAEGWKSQKGVVRVEETLKLARPLVVFSSASAARRYLLWLRSDAEAANQFALEQVRDETAFIIPEASPVIVTQCEEEDEEDCLPLTSLFYVASVDGTEGWAPNLVLRQHRAAKKK